MPSRLLLVLTEAEAVTLQDLRDHHPLPYLRERASALLAIARGQSARQVAAHGPLRRRTYRAVSDWVHRYAVGGIAGLHIRPGRGRKPAFSPALCDGHRRPSRSARGAPS